jgi:hypothetical protein
LWTRRLPRWPLQKPTQTRLRLAGAFEERRAAAAQLGLCSTCLRLPETDTVGEITIRRQKPLVLRIMVEQGRTRILFLSGLTPRCEQIFPHRCCFQPVRRIRQRCPYRLSVTVWGRADRRVWIAGERHPTGHLPVPQPALSGALLFWAGSGMAGRQRRLSPAALGA